MEARPLLDHFDELVKRLRRCIFLLMIGAIAGYFVSGRAIELLQVPLLERLPSNAHLVFITPFEKFWVYMRVGFIAGAILVAPGILRELLKFLSPALSQKERIRILVLILSSAVVFAVGVGVGYKFVLPAVIEAILNFGGGAELPFITLSAYINTTIGLLLATALFLEVPVLMTLLSSWGLVDSALWGKGRRIAIVANALVSAILSPPDALSMIVMMVPLHLLYECGILGARLGAWRSKKRKYVEGV